MKTRTQNLLTTASVAISLLAIPSAAIADSLISFEIEKADKTELHKSKPIKIRKSQKKENTTSTPKSKIIKSPKENSQAILILDASGSMWGKIDNRTKIDIAKEVVGTTVKDWSSSIDLGLVAYGHNRKGDCSDIEMLIEPNKLNKAAFIEQANSLNPKGKTPLTEAVKQAAEALKYSEEKATVILVSDGKETCDLDPCVIGEQLENNGVDFTAHVIGFDVSVEDSAGLRCMAEKTGGVYLDAKNAKDLKEAMAFTREATEEAKPVEEPEEAPIELPTATIVVPDEVVAGTEFPVEWTGPKNEYDYLKIRTDDLKLGFDSSNIGKPETVSPTRLTAPEKEGKYVVQYMVSDTQVIGSATLNVVPPKVTLEVPSEVAQGSKFEVKWIGPLNKGDDLRLFKSDGQQLGIWTSLEKDKSVSPATMQAPNEIGDYEVRYVGMHGHSYAKSAFKVIESPATVDAPDTVPAGSYFDVAWTGPKNEFDNIRVFGPEGKQTGRYQHIDKEDSVSPVSLRAPAEPGEYEVRYMISGKKSLAVDKFTIVEVSATVNAPETVPAGSEFKVEWTGSKAQYDRIRIFDAEGKDTREFTSVDKEDSVSPVTLTAPVEVGKYSVRFMASDRKLLAEDAFTVTEISATINAPDRVKANKKFLVEWTGPKNKSDRLRIYTLDGKNQNRGASIGRKNSESPVEIKAPRKAGEYEIRYITTKGRVLATEKITVTNP